MTKSKRTLENGRCTVNVWYERYEVKKGYTANVFKVIILLIWFKLIMMKSHFPVRIFF